MRLIPMNKEAAVAAVPLIAAARVVGHGRYQRGFSYSRVMMKVKPARPMDVNCLQLGMLTFGCERLTGPPFLRPVLLLKPVNH